MSDNRVEDFEISEVELIRSKLAAEKVRRLEVELELAKHAANDHAARVYAQYEGGGRYRILGAITEGKGKRIDLKKKLVEPEPAPVEEKAAEEKPASP